jgi:hypothetical protein
MVLVEGWGDGGVDELVKGLLKEGIWIRWKTGSSIM